MITIQVNSAEVVATLDNLAARQMPQATAWAINAVGIDFEQGQREYLGEIFRLRGNPAWATGPKSLSVKFLSPFANKSNPSITMGIDPQVDFLSKFEAGGTKTAQSGDVAIPDDILSDPMQILTASQRPKALFADQKANQVFAVRSGESDRLPPGIWQRDGRKLRRLFVLAQSVPIPAELNFESNAQAIVTEMWPQRFSESFERAMSAARENGAEIDARPHDTSAQ